MKRVNDVARASRPWICLDKKPGVPGNGRDARATLAVLALFSLTLMACQSTSAAGEDSKGISRASTVDDVLDALDVRGKSLQALSADVKTTDIDPNTGDETIHSGNFVLQKKGEDDAQAKIVFTSKENGNHKVAEDHQYILDDGKLVERDFGAKKQITRQVVKPGQKMNLLKLGDGPFPLPIGQKKEDVKAQFDVKKIDPDVADPANSIHLRLTPKANTSFAKKFKTIDVWVDPATSMPVSIDTMDATGATEKKTDFTNVKINPDLPRDAFTVPKAPDGWETIDEPYGE